MEFSPPWSASHELQPGRLWSLWDMLKQYGFIFHVAGKHLEDLQRGCEILSRMKDAPQGPEVLANIKISAQHMVTVSTELSLKASLAQAKRVVEMTDNANYPALRTAIVELSSRIQDELSNQWFYFIPPELLDFYFNKNLFGDDVDTKFSATKEDIENAGKCLALGQSTATVFHLMRAMEAAVGGLATKLEIPKPDREWGKLLSDIHAKIEQMPKGEIRDSWSECHANLYHVKQAWRHGTMHPKETYTPDQAKEVFQAVRVFMSQLAGLV